MTPNEPTSKNLKPQQRGDLAPRKADSLYLTLFEPLHADRILTWIRDDRELTWLAPGTPPPLSSDKIVAWGKDFGRRLLLWPQGGESPIGYAELNRMPINSSQMWIGHFVLDPTWRGHSMGHRFAGALLASAFLECAATDVVLVVFPDNLPAIRCYERTGFLVTGQESKFFDATQREHVFLRMSITASRFFQLVSAGKLPGKPLVRRASRAQ